MIASRQNLLFGIITILFLIPYMFGWVLPIGFDTWALVFSLAVTGIPHGAIDHVIFLQNQQGAAPKRNLLQSFFTPYLLMIGTTFALWFVIPQLMFLFFLMVAAYHFGQSQLYYIILPEKSKGKTLMYLSWGTFILASLWFFHWQEQRIIIQSVFNWNLAPQGLVYNIVLGVLILSGLVIGYLLFYFYKKGNLTGKMLLQEFAVLGLLTAMFYYTTPFIAFAIYFGLWHATRVIFTEYHFLKHQNGQKLSIFSFIKSFLPFSLLSFLGLALLFWLSNLLQASISPFMLFLIFISALTMPHAFFMERMYQFLGKIKRDGKASPALQIS
jgi:Brp/Blh family beta-carotene 15,15'-monooxygenase